MGFRRKRQSTTTVLLALCGTRRSAGGSRPRRSDERRQDLSLLLSLSTPTCTGSTTRPARARLINLNDLFDDLRNAAPGVKLVLIDACRNEMKAESAHAQPRRRRRCRIPRGVGALFSCSADEKAVGEREAASTASSSTSCIEGLSRQGEERGRRRDVGRPVGYVTRQVDPQVPMIVGGGARQTAARLQQHRGRGRSWPASTRRRRRSSKAQKKPDLIENTIGMKLVCVPPGKFTMGSPRRSRTRSIADSRNREGRGGRCTEVHA